MKLIFILISLFSVHLLAETRIVPDEMLFAIKNNQQEYQKLRTLKPIQIPISVFREEILQSLATVSGVGSIVDIDFINGKPVGSFSNWKQGQKVDFCSIQAILKYQPGMPYFEVTFSDLKLKPYYAEASQGHAFVLTRYDEMPPNPRYFKTGGAIGVSCIIEGKPVNAMTIGFLRSSLGKDSIEAYY